jgi:hypothetical protein
MFRAPMSSSTATARVVQGVYGFKCLHGQSKFNSWRVPKSVRIRPCKSLAAVTAAGIILLTALWVTTSVALSPIHISFGTDDIGKFPSGWQARDKTNMIKVYSVQAEEGTKFLHADALAQSVQIMYEKGWALRELPVLHWTWRAVLFPEGSNEQEKSGNDSALGIYVVFTYFPVRTIKYIWSDTLPVGSSFNSPYSSGAKMVVVRSGRTSMGTWVSEERNILEEYRHLFGETEKDTVAKGIAILTDADNTRSHAAGDYADIELLGSNGERVPTTVSFPK